MQGGELEQLWWLIQLVCVAIDSVTFKAGIQDGTRGAVTGRHWTLPPLPGLLDLQASTALFNSPVTCSIYLSKPPILP